MTQTTTDLPAIERVMSVYSGTPGCMCGCRGTHRYASAHRDAAALARGYAIADDEVSDRSVKLILGKLARAGVALDVTTPTIRYAEIGSRCYALYLTEEVVTIDVPEGSPDLLARAIAAYGSAVSAMSQQLTDSSDTVDPLRDASVAATDAYARAAGLGYVDALRAVRAAAGFGR